MSARTKRSLRLTIAWLIVLAQTAAATREAFEVQFASTRAYALLYFFLLAVIGTLRRWGAPVLFALGGFSITYYWHLFGVVSSSEMEAVMQELGLPAISAACGALVGYGLELWWSCGPRLRRAFKENEGWPPVSNASKPSGLREQSQAGARFDG